MFATLDSRVAVFAQMVFERDMGQSLLDLGFELRYEYTTDPEPMRVLTSMLVFSYQWRVGS
jgi:hypothetical protein